MKHLKFLPFFGWTLLSSSLLVALVLERPVLSVAARNLTAAEANGGEAPKLLVWPGRGLTLNFIPSGESIQKVWLDDPSRLGIDFDTDMCAVLMGDCASDNSASVIHLRRINNVFSADNPAPIPLTESTLLTVITQSTSGRKVYQFEIGYGSGTPEYTAVNITPPLEVAAEPKPALLNPTTAAAAPSWQNRRLVETREKDIPQQLNLERLEAAVTSPGIGAIASEGSEGNAQLKMRLRQFIYLVRNGMTPERALNLTGISADLLQEVQQLDRQQHPHNHNMN
jgi:hypothetical protein